MKRRAILARGLSASVLCFIAGCSALRPDPGQKPGEVPIWTGRLALNLASEPPQSFFANFELKGTASAGELTLTSPLGIVVAAMLWSPGEATLRTGQQSQPFDSMESLTRHVTGAALPVHALFDWLEGINTSGAGWQADLSRLDLGRLVATRMQPMPAAELKLILDR